LLTDLFISHHKRVAGIEIYFQSADAYQCFCTVLAYEQKKVVSESYIGPIKDISELLTLLNPTIPLYLTVNGKVVLFRKKSNTSESSIEAMFPGLNKDDFYVDENDNGFIVVTRKKIVDDCINLFNQKGFKVAGVKLGPVISENVYSFLQVTKNLQQTIHAGYTGLVFMGDHLSQFDFTETFQQPVLYSLTESKEQISSQYLISYASAIQGYQDTSSVDIPSVSLNAEYWKFKLFVRKWGSRFVALLFSILLINTIFYFNIFPKHKEVEQRFLANQSLLQEVDKLEAEIKGKEKFLLSNGIEQEQSSLALYADRIASTIPASISLTRLSLYSPRISRDKEEKLYSYDANVIVIDGTCRQDLALNSWVKAMKGLFFVHDVTIHSLNKDLNNTISFEMEVMLK
jgi:hypothetical protein